MVEFFHLLSMDTIISIFERVMSLLRAAQLMPDFASARGVFCAIAWFATILSLISLVLALFADFGGDADADLPGDAADGGTGSLSVRAVIAFLLGLGWGGFVATQWGLSTFPSLCVGILLGLVLFFIVAVLMRLIYGMKSDGTLKYSDLIGLQGTVYVTIPPHGEPGGQVQVAHPGQLVTMPAIQHGDSPLSAQSSIIVVEATPQRLVVRPADFPSS